MFRTVLFDFDGTLTPSLELWMQAYHYALAHFNLKLSDEQIMEKLFYKDYLEAAVNVGLPRDKEFGRQIEAGLVLAFERASLFPQVPELLRASKQAGLVTGVVTTSSRKQVMTNLVRFGIDHYFDTVVSADDVKNYKPHPEPVLLALSRLDAKPEETLFVGDHAVDILAGKAAGVSTALFMPEVHSRYYDFEELRQTEPDHIFTHHSEIIQFLKLEAAA